MKTHITNVATIVSLLMAVGCGKFESASQVETAAAAMTVTLHLDGFMKSKSGAT
jgi:hypothetical protein